MERQIAVVYIKTIDGQQAVLSADNRCLGIAVAALSGFPSGFAEFPVAVLRFRAGLVISYNPA